MNNKSLPWTRVGTKLTVILPNGQPKTVTESNKELFDKVIECIKLGDWDKVPDLLDTKTAIFNFSDGNFQVVNGVVQVQGKPVPSGLSKKIIAFAKEQLPYHPLIKFWEKLSRNPSFRNVQGLFEFLEVNNYPITEDGDIIAYKKIKEDWTDCYTGTILNTIGSIVSMPRNEVNDNPELTCQSGFHIGNWAFSWGFREGRMIMVSVNPEHVVSMPTAYEFTKIRVCEYTVLHEVDQEQQGILYQTQSVDKEEIQENCDCINYNCIEYDSHHQDCDCNLDYTDCNVF